MTDAPPESIPLPTFGPEEKVCGNCRLWQPHSTDHRGWVGPCRVQPQRGLFPPSAPICDAFVPKGGAGYAGPPRPEPARPTRARVTTVAPVVRRKGESGEPALLPPSQPG